MDRVRIELQNCYGIGTLSREFDFLTQKAYAIYAPNGSMKSSLAQTFKDIAEGVESGDRIFPTRKTVRKVTDENNADLPQTSILVLPPYDEFFGPTKETSTLLVNNSLRKQYEQLHSDIDKAKADFLAAMRKQSGSKRKVEDLEQEISLTFTKTPDDFYTALNRIKEEVRAQQDMPFATVEYDTIFDEKVLALLATKDFKTKIEEYIKRYNELLSKSTYFKQGIFEYYNAAQVAKTLADNGFFNAKHTVTLNAQKKLEITTQKQLQELIAAELENITNDADLKRTFIEIKKLLEKNEALREFQKYLCSQGIVLPQLANIELFKERIWKSYFKANQGVYDALLEKFEQVKTGLKAIEKTAQQERTQWEKAIDLFNDRFFVPFKLEAKNKVAVTLGHEQMLTLSYTFSDETDSAAVEQKKLMEVLSQGEKKALYILNIIFEIEVRRQNQTETLFVIDDIADSFDYKNKYAIVQYLQEISEGPAFKMIMLTHNFDFFRTVHLRSIVPYGNCLLATKTGTDVKLTQASGIKNVFVNDWKGEFFNDNKKRIASIAFMRNLIEYLHGDTDKDYLTLTSLLHWRPDSAGITQGAIDTIYNRLFGSNGQSADGGKRVLDVIEQEAIGCLQAGEGANFEHKIVLSIAIRLAAERYMDSSIGDAAFLANLNRNQTTRLLKRFQQMYAGEVETIRVLEEVILMTPENIHLNSFMYEPILDMSDDHLRKLYTKVCALAAPAAIAPAAP